MRVFQGWPGLLLFTLNLHVRITELLHLFNVLSLYIDTFLPSQWQGIDASNKEGVMPTVSPIHDASR